MFGQFNPYRLINLDKVIYCTFIIFDIWFLETPLANRSLMRLRFLASFNLFDSAQTGLPSLTPCSFLEAREHFVLWLMRSLSIWLARPKAKANTCDCR